MSNQSYSSYYNMHSRVTTIPPEIRQHPSASAQNTPAPKKPVTVRPSQRQAARQYGMYNQYAPSIAPKKKNHFIVLEKSLKKTKAGKCIVIIPVYRKEPSNEEHQFIVNNLSKLKDLYDICILCPQSVDVNAYSKTFGYEFQYVKCDETMFISKASYSFMLESASFYEEFKQWEYMLICQPDAYIFGDGKELEKFMDYGYAYIGGPWKPEYSFPLIKRYEELSGNGGLSLRNIKAMTELLKSTLSGIMMFRESEDFCISKLLYRKKQNCPAGVARKFAIDNNPEYWTSGKYEKEALPWGLHLGNRMAHAYWSKKMPDIFKPRHAKNLIVSLTSFGDRLKYDLPLTLDYFCKTQSIVPEKICLTLYKDDLKNVTPALDKVVKEYGIEIIVAEENLRPHLKYYYTMKKYPTHDIITIDDDIYYQSTLIEDLLRLSEKNPGCIISGRCHRMRYNGDGTPIAYNKWELECGGDMNASYDLFATGVGGVLYQAGILKTEEMDIGEIKSLITTDDIYLKLLENRKGIKVCGLPDNKRWVNKIKQCQSKYIVKNRLCNQNTRAFRNTNDENIKKCGLTRIREKKPDDGKTKICYTCISGNYDKLTNPRYVTPGWKYICFTDQKNIKSTGVWEVRSIPEEIMNDKSLNQVKRQRYMKTCPHRFLGEYDVCIWVDGNITITGNLDYFTEEVLQGKTEFAVTVHPDRDCIYKEGSIILMMHKDKKDIIDRQTAKYRSEGFPEHFGLNETNVLVRKNTDGNKEIGDAWWNEIRNHSHRDQMSFNYILWKLKRSVYNITVRKRNENFICRRHGR